MNKTLVFFVHFNTITKDYSPLVRLFAAMGNVNAMGQISIAFSINFEQIFLKNSFGAEFLTCQSTKKIWST